MSMNNADKPAYPSHNANEHSDARNKVSGGGLTKRERFAMAAMQGLCANEYPTRYPQDMVEDAVEIADYLLTELEETQ